jgi:hypothetical protein
VRPGGRGNGQGHLASRAARYRPLVFTTPLPLPDNSTTSFSS